MNKFIDGGEREKWTSWLTLKRQKNEQVDPEERKQSVTDVGQKAYRKQIYPWEMTIKQVGCFLFFSIFNTFHQFSGFCVGRNFILCSIPDILGFEWVKSHEKWARNGWLSVF